MTNDHPESEQQIKRLLYEGVAEGDIEITGEKDGEHTFTLTEQGQRHIEQQLDVFIHIAVDACAAYYDIPHHMAHDLIHHRITNT